MDFFFFFFLPSPTLVPWNLQNACRKSVFLRMLLLTLMPTHIKWDEIFLIFFLNNAPFVMTPDDHQTPTSISHEKWEVPWVFFHILIVQGIYLYNIKVIEPLTSALIFFLYVYKKQKNDKKIKLKKIEEPNTNHQVFLGICPTSPESFVEIHCVFWKIWLF